jgi:hypothetical protein
MDRKAIFSKNRRNKINLASAIILNFGIMLHEMIFMLSKIRND